jgi:hypothetical protein
VGSAFPESAQAVRSFNSTVVDANGNDVTATELYVHHYILFSNPNMPGPTHVGGYCAGW